MKRILTLAALALATTALGQEMAQRVTVKLPTKAMCLICSQNGESEEEKPAGPVKSIEHNGFTIHATPYQDGGQYQLCGVIEKVIDGESE